MLQDASGLREGGGRGRKRGWEREEVKWVLIRLCVHVHPLHESSPKVL